MKQVLATVISKGNPIGGLSRPYGRSIIFSLPIRLNCPEIAQQTRPGQFVMVDCGEDTLLPRPFSIHQVIDKEDVSLYFAVLEDGKGTTWLSQRQPGDLVKMPIPKPLGNGFALSPDSKNLLLVAGGMGIAPLYFLAEETAKQGRDVTLLYGTANKDRYPISLTGVKTINATEDGSVGHPGLVTDLLADFTGEADQIVACGPLSMYRTMAQNAELKNKAVQVSLETRMGCGRGLCYGCSVKTKQGQKKICSDGPVFNMDDIIWDELSLY